MSTDGQSLRHWRRDKRKRLLAQRMAAGDQQRAEWNDAIGVLLRPLLPTAKADVIAFYWPFRGEYDARPLMCELAADGVCIALPVVVEAQAPLQFHHWQPGVKMTRGVYDIPIPATPDPVVPTVVVAPLVGFDAAGYRLGYGGGYYDRTLASFSPRPLIIGVGYELARLDTLEPQPHDVAMDVIVTEAGLDDHR